MRFGPVWALVLVCACTPPRDLAWQVEFTEPGLRDRVRVFEAEIREGGCTGPVIWSLAFDVDAPPSSMGPPDLPPGTYGFAVTARDTNCSRYALGCSELELPQEDGASVSVTVDAFPGGTACPSDICMDGVCDDFDAGVAGGCPVGRGDCNFDPSDSCETPLNTLDACGTCGSICRLDHATPECSGGTCAVAACDDGWSDCNGIPNDGCETSVRTPSDCGSCGMTCDLANASETCETGSCALRACYPGWDNCNGVATDGCEASLMLPTSCGSCTNVCSAAAPLCDVATNTCVALCTSTQCGSTCVDLTSNPQHCSACNNVCSTSRGTPGCSASTCTIAMCNAEFQDCNATLGDGCETPVFTATDCGTCGTPCNSSTGVLSCATGTCQVDSCNPGLADCDGTLTNGCEADLSASTSCGSCTITCQATTPVCGVDDGIRACLAECIAPLPDLCGDRCFDNASDVENCGSCGRSCSLDNANVRCIEGDCRVGTCLAGFGDCDGSSANGCETVLADDPDNCGGCDIACTDGANSTGACAGSACIAVCNDGFGDCDDDPSNGCEQALDSLDHCGACDSACAPPNATGTCNGSCDVGTCDMGFTDCDGLVGNGCEAQTASDPRNCGMCGRRCSGSQRNCCSGVCCA